MIGQDLAVFMSLPMFQKQTMDKILEEIQLPGDPLRFSNAFMPLKKEDDDTLTALIWEAITGKTQPYALNANVPLIEMGGFFIREWAGYEWREGIRFGEKELVKIKNPEKPTERWGEGLIARAIMALKMRMNNMLEFTSAQTILQGGYAIAKAGINYTYRITTVPNLCYIKLDHTAFTSAVGMVFLKADWVSVSDDTMLWSATTTAKPLLDIAKMISYAQGIGINITDMWMPPSIADYLELNTDVQTWMKANPQYVAQFVTNRNLIAVLPGFKGINVTIDERKYIDQTVGTANIGTSDTVIHVEDSSAFLAAQKVLIISEDGKDYVRATISSIAVNAITLSAAVGVAFTGKWRLQVSKSYLADAYGREKFVVFRADAIEGLHEWASMPSALGPGGSIQRPTPGPGTYRDQSPYSAQPWIEVGSAVSGGPYIANRGGFIVLKVA